MRRVFVAVIVVMAVGAIRLAIAQEPQPVHGKEYAAAVNLIQRNVKAEARMFAPDAAKRVRGVWVTVWYGLAGTCCFSDESWRTFAESAGLAMINVRFSTISEAPLTVWRNAELGGADALLSVLDTLGRDAQRPELSTVPILFWGHSQAGGFGTTFAALHPDRTIGSIRYHVGPVGLDNPAVVAVPMLLFLGDRDTVGVPAQGQAKTLWEAGRRNDAPWTLAIEPHAEHANVSDVQKANAFLFSWITGMLGQRLTAEGKLRDVRTEIGWLGNVKDSSIAPFTSAPFAKDQAAWFPDEASAKAWREITSR